MAERHQLILESLEGLFDVLRFGPGTPIPSELTACTFFWIGRTEHELSIVCPATLDLRAPQRERGWVAFRVVGTLDFSLTGIMARLLEPLAAARISVFALSTFDTDTLLVKQDNVARARQVWLEAGIAVSPL